MSFALLGVCRFLVKDRHSSELQYSGRIKTKQFQMSSPFFVCLRPSRCGLSTFDRPLSPSLVVICPLYVQVAPLARDPLAALFKHKQAFQYISSP